MTGPQSRVGVGEWLRGLNLGGLTWKPLAGLALVILVIAGGIGYAVGTGGGSGDAHTTEIEPGTNGIAAKVVTEDDRGELHLAGVKPLPKGRVLEAWVERDGIVEAVPALFAPDQAGQRLDHDREHEGRHRGDGDARARGRLEEADDEAVRRRPDRNLSGARGSRACASVS